MKKKFKIIILLSVAFCLLSVNFCLAAKSDILPEPSNDKCPPGYTGNCGGYTLNDMVEILPMAANWMLGIVGSLALLMFVYGGLLIMLAGETTITGTEKTTKVNKGKDAIKNAIVGLIIVFTSYMIIGFIFTATGTSTSGTSWSNTDWFNNKPVVQDD